MRIRSKKGIPTPFPTRGGVTLSNHPLFTMDFKSFRVLCCPRLRSVLWLARQQLNCLDAALAKNLPRRSRSPHGFTHGRVRRVASGTGNPTVGESRVPQEVLNLLAPELGDCLRPLVEPEKRQKSP
jgi:hypothetical protein